jgi:hypothetical protein
LKLKAHNVEIGRLGIASGVGVCGLSVDFSQKYLELITMALKADIPSSNAHKAEVRQVFMKYLHDLASGN